MKVYVQRNLMPLHKLEELLKIYREINIRRGLGSVLEIEFYDLQRHV